MEERDKLLAQSEIMLDHAKYLNKKIKEAKIRLEHVTEERKRSYFYDEATSEEIELTYKIDFLIQEKISVEKFGKKLRHQANEI